jgi:hypothetical protein
MVSPPGIGSGLAVTVASRLSSCSRRNGLDGILSGKFWSLGRLAGHANPISFQLNVPTHCILR